MMTEEEKKKRAIEKSRRESMSLLMSIECQITKDKNNCYMKKSGIECPFTEKLCKEVSCYDWIKWLEHQYK